MPVDPREFGSKGERHVRRHIENEQELTHDSFEKTVTVIVGEEKRHFAIHEHLLCQSPFFAAALKEKWKEGRDRLILLEDDVPEIFALYAQWLYRRKIFSRESIPSPVNADGELEILLDTYVFAEKVQAEDFQDAIIDAIIGHTNTEDEDGRRWYPGSSAVNRAYTMTPVGSPLRRLLVDFHIYHGEYKWIKGPINQEFLLDLLQELWKYAVVKGKSPTSTSSSSCSYHRHQYDQLCYSKQQEKD